MSVIGSFVLMLVLQPPLEVHAWVAHGCAPNVLGDVPLGCGLEARPS